MDSRAWHAKFLGPGWIREVLTLPPGKSTFRTAEGTCLTLLRVVLVFNSIDLLKEVADPIHLKSQWKSSRAEAGSTER